MKNSKARRLVRSAQRVYFGTLVLCTRLRRETTVTFSQRSAGVREQLLALTRTAFNLKRRVKERNGQKKPKK